MIWSSCDGGKEFHWNVWISRGCWTYLKTSNFHLILCNWTVSSRCWTCLTFPLSLGASPHLHLLPHRRVCPCSTFQSVPAIEIDTVFASMYFIHIDCSLFDKGTVFSFTYKADPATCSSFWGESQLFAKLCGKREREWMAWILLDNGTGVFSTEELYFDFF